MNTEGRLIAVGDIHGYLPSLENVFQQVSPVEHDNIVFLGDYIDIGPSSREVIDFLIEFKKKHHKCVFLMGNHEQILINYISGIEREKYLLNSGYTTLRQYKVRNELSIPEEHLEFLKELLPYYENDKFIFVHAGLKPGFALSENDINTILWIGGEFVESDYDWGKKVVFGHTPLDCQFRSKNKISLNCDIENRGLVVCCELNDGVYWSSKI